MRPAILEFLAVVQSHPLYWISLLFFAAYPVLSAITWVTTALHFYFRRERGDDVVESPPAMLHYPTVSVLIPAYCEGKVIAETLEAATQLFTGVLLDSRYDRTLLRHYPVAVVYPIVYWMLMSVITVLATPVGWFGSTAHGRVTLWRTER